MVGIAQLVEQQVVVLEVVGSSPTTYPIMWQIEKLNTVKSFQLQIYTQIIPIMLNFLKQYKVIFINYKYIYSKLKISLLNNTAIKNSKILYKYNDFKQVRFNTSILKPMNNSSSLFRVYTTLLTQNINSYQQIHPTQRLYFLLNTSMNTQTFNLSKLKLKWNSIYNLLFNMFYYEIPLLTFATRIFRKELLSLNWTLNKTIISFWKYIEPSFYLVKNKIIRNEYFLFSNLNKKGYHTALVFDILYHHKTLFTLKRNNFYTIGLVPTQFTLFSVNSAIPVNSNNVYMQLFFLRFVIFIKKQTKLYFSKQQSLLWKNLLYKW